MLVKDQIREFLIKEQALTAYQFDMLFDMNNISRLNLPFFRYKYADMFVDFIKDIRPDLIEQVRTIGNSVHDLDFPLKSQETLDFIKKLNLTTHLVIVTLGDPVDQIRKLYKIGLYDVKVECVVHKNHNTYASLMSKYPSKKYKMIGDNVASDIIAAKDAGIVDSFLVTTTYPITSLTTLTSLVPHNEVSDVSETKA